MSLLRRAMIVVKTKEPLKAKLGHLRNMQVSEHAPTTPSDHGETPATIDESDVK